MSLTFKPFLSSCAVDANSSLTTPYLSNCHSLFCGREPAYVHTLRHEAARIIFPERYLIKIRSYATTYSCNLYASDRDSELHLGFKTSATGNPSCSHSLADCLTPLIHLWMHHTCHHNQAILFLFPKRCSCYFSSRDLETITYM